MTAIDPSTFKAAQRGQWDSVAEGWGRWWPTFEAGAQTVSDRMVALASLAGGHAVLDIASGIGEPATTAAIAVGAGGRVLATDLADDMLAIAQQRAQAAGLSHMEFRQMDAENLDVKDGEFDAALCRWGLMFMPDRVRALAEMARAVKPGGRVVAAVLGAPERFPVLSLPMAVAGALFGVSPPPPGTPGPFVMSDPQALPQAMRDAGLQNVAGECQQMLAEFETPAAFASFVRDIAAPIRQLIQDRPAAEQAAFWEALEAAVAKFADADGAVRLTNDTHVAVGVKA